MILLQNILNSYHHVIVILVSLIFLCGSLKNKQWPKLENIIEMLAYVSGADTAIVLFKNVWKNGFLHAGEMFYFQIAGAIVLFLVCAKGFWKVFKKIWIRNFVKDEKI